MTMQEKPEQSPEQAFLSNVAHELRSPVTIVRGYTQQMLEGVIPKAEWRQYLNVISQEMQRLELMVASMLSLTRYQNGVLPLEKKAFLIQPVLLHTALLYESRLEKKEILLDGLERTGRILFYGDADLLGQVVYNLFDNAVKFVNTGGRIGFAVREDGEMQELSISNTGAGIPTDRLQTLFERFSTSGNGLFDNADGLGIGLHLVQRIVELHGGTVSVRVETDGTTIFSVRLPKQSAVSEQ